MFVHIYQSSNETRSTEHLVAITFGYYFSFCLFVFDAAALQWATASSFTRVLDHIQRRTTVGRTPLDEWSARLRDLYLTTHNIHNRHQCHQWDSNPPISAGERPKTYAVDCAVIGTGIISRLPSTNTWCPHNRVPEDGRCHGRYRWTQGLCGIKLQSSGNYKLDICIVPTPSTTASLLLLFLFATAAQYQAWSRPLQWFSKSLLSTPASCFENFRLKFQLVDQLSWYTSLVRGSYRKSWATIFFVK